MVSVPWSALITSDVATATFAAAVTKPLALTVNTGIFVTPPNVPTLLLTVLRTRGTLAFAVPSTETIPVASPLTPMFLAVNHLVAVEALPANSALITEAEKPPEESLLTRVLIVFDGVAASTI